MALTHKLYEGHVITTHRGRGVRPAYSECSCGKKFRWNMQNYRTPEDLSTAMVEAYTKHLEFIADQVLGKEERQRREALILGVDMN